jgi:glucosamine--fructose-6-phosphate aminotransferase (isomerizing)
MKSLGNFPDPFIAEIAGQPAALRRAAEGLASQLPALARLADMARDGHPSALPIFTGMGSSYFACYPAVTELAAARVAALHIGTAELLHFRRELLGPQTTLIAVSQSGRSAELVRLAGELGEPAARPTTVAVTNGLDNPLAAGADVALDTMAGDEACPSTMTFAAALVVVAAVGAVLAGEPAADVAARLLAEAESAAAAIERLMADRSLPDRLLERFGSRDAVVLLGRGASRAAAEMGALTLKEAVGLAAESLETGQFRHGPLEIAGPGLAALVIAVEPETRALDVGLTEELLAAGAAVALVSRDGEGPAAALRVPIGDVSCALAPAVANVPAQLLAWRMAVLGGREPGSFVLASKVTTRE